MRGILQLLVFSVLLSLLSIFSVSVCTSVIFTYSTTDHGRVEQWNL